MTNSEARKRHQAAQAPVSRPNAAPVDSGANGRLNERQRAEIGWAVERDWQLRDQRDDWDGLYAVVERIVREHTDRALAEHRREWADYFEHWSGAVGPEPLTVALAIEALRAESVPFGRAAGREQGRG